MFPISTLPTEKHLIAAALGLGAADVGPWSAVEKQLVQCLPAISTNVIRELSARVRMGEDPLGDVFCKLRSPEARRPMGATYTPREIVESMLDWTAEFQPPDQVIDPGAGSGRFLIEAGRRYSSSSLIGVELDPAAAILARGCLAAAGFSKRGSVHLADFRTFEAPSVAGATLYVGNPPYIRHHLIGRRWKEWLKYQAAKIDRNASQLAGSHVHFFLAVALRAKPGDFGAFITAAEWLDVNYGSLVRELLMNHLGLRTLTLIDPTAQAFAETATTAVIAAFNVGTGCPAIRFRRIKTIFDLGRLSEGEPVSRERLESETRWSSLTRRSRQVPEGFVELGEVFRVHRGQVTGANAVWIAGDHSRHLPASVLYKSVTRAREVIEARGILDDASKLRSVIDIPADLDRLAIEEREAVRAFLNRVRAMGADKGYIAANRRAWWSVALRQPAPIVTTYMARRPPAFALNAVHARHLNIAHGLYPVEELTIDMLRRFVDYLQRSIRLDQGRMYAGGLAKFEPREMERLPVPSPAMIVKETDY